MEGQNFIRWLLVTFSFVTSTLNASTGQYVAKMDQVLVGDMDSSCCKLEWIDGTEKKARDTAIVQKEWGPNVSINAWYIRVGTKLGFHPNFLPLNSSVKVLANPNGCQIRWIERETRANALGSDYWFIPVYQNVIFGHSFYLSNPNHGRLFYERTGGNNFYSSLGLNGYVDKKAEHLARLHIMCNDFLGKFGFRFHSINFDNRRIRPTGQHFVTTGKTKNDGTFHTQTSQHLEKEYKFFLDLSIDGLKLPFKINPNGHKKTEMFQVANKFFYPLYKSVDFLDSLKSWHSGEQIKITDGTVRLEWNSTKNIPSKVECVTKYWASSFSLKSPVEVAFEVFPLGHNSCSSQVNEDVLIAWIKHHGFSVSKDKKKDLFIAKSEGHIELRSFYATEPEFECL